MKKMDASRCLCPFWGGNEGGKRDVSLPRKFEIGMEWNETHINARAAEGDRENLCAWGRSGTLPFRVFISLQKSVFFASFPLQRLVPFPSVHTAKGVFPCMDMGWPSKGPFAVAFPLPPSPMAWGGRKKKHRSNRRNHTECVPVSSGRRRHPWP